MTQYALPILDVSKSSWTQLAGNSDANSFDELDEGFGAGRGSGSGPDDATTAWQSDNISNVTRAIECALSAIGDPLASTGHVIRARIAKSATGGATLTYTIGLYQGATLIASGAPTVYNATAYTTLTYTLSVAEADAITDYAALRLRLAVTFSTGTARRARLSALELETPDAAQIRYYILPIIRSADLTSRGPKYFQWGKENKIGTIICQWSMKDYGDIDQAIMCTYISAADHATVSANSDVLALPVNIDTTMSAGAVSAAQTFLETYNIPANWINTGDTYRATLRITTAFFLFMQRTTGILGHGITLPGNWANLTMANVPVDIRDAMAAAADSFGYDYSWVTDSTTVRQVLKGMADAWGTQPILFGFATL